ncbi:MAG: SH3 domain-containing protein [Acidobacteriota bacterium]
MPPPKDESSRDKTLGVFLAQLKDALKRKDRDGLLALLAVDVKTGVRAFEGPNAFFTAWGLADPNTAVYGIITQILSLPGVWVQEQYCAPYVGVMFPPDLDASKHQVILNPNISLRAEASANSRALATVSYEIVEVLERGEWTKIKTQAGVTGFIPIAYLYSPAGYRACFAKNPAGDWRIQSLAAGR